MKVSSGENLSIDIDRFSPDDTFIDRSASGLVLKLQTDVLPAGHEYNGRSGIGSHGG